MATSVSDTGVHQFVISGRELQGLVFGQDTQCDSGRTLKATITAEYWSAVRDTCWESGFFHREQRGSSFLPLWLFIYSHQTSIAGLWPQSLFKHWQRGFELTNDPSDQLFRALRTGDTLAYSPHGCFTTMECAKVFWVKAFLESFYLNKKKKKT